MIHTFIYIPLCVYVHCTIIMYFSATPDYIQQSSVPYDTSWTDQISQLTFK